MVSKALVLSQTALVRANTHIWQLRAKVNKGLGPENDPCSGQHPDKQRSSKALRLMDGGPYKPT